MQLGDIVTGTYYGAGFEGQIESFDFSGWVYIRLVAPIRVNGRDEAGPIGIDPRHPDRKSLRLVSRPAEVQTGRVGDLVYMRG